MLSVRHPRARAARVRHHGSASQPDRAAWTAPRGRAGHRGFAFTKVDAAGEPLADQTQPYATEPWDCVRDEVTALVWEIKTDDGGLRDKDWTYTWYNSTGINDGGSPGASAGGTCVGAA